LLFACHISIQIKRVLQILAPALRASLPVTPGHNDQLNLFLKLKKEELFAAVDASVDSLKKQLEMAHCKYQTATQAKANLQATAAASKDPSKFSTFKGAGGTIDDFHKGLEDRIGESVDFFLTREDCNITLQMHHTL
jgi:hypothetical protein